MGKIVLTQRWPSVLAKESSDLISNTLGSGENENLVALVVHDALEMLDHAITLLHLRDNFHDLCDSVVGGEVHGSNVDLDEVILVVVGKCADFFWPCSRPHTGLSVRSNLSNDLANLGLETHVKHTIGLIENEVGDTAEVGLSRLQHVDQTTWSGDADFDTTSEVANLLSLGNTSVDAGISDAGRFSELADFLLDLDSQLTGGCENENDGSVTRSEEWLGVDMDNGG